jgi:hypothetical protein
MRLRSAKLRLFIIVVLTTIVVVFIFQTCFPNVTTWYPTKIFFTSDTRRIAQVAIDGDTLLVYGVEHCFPSLRKGDEGAVISIHNRSGSDWVRQAQLPTDDVHPSGFIKHMGISGNTIVIANSVPKQPPGATASISILNKEGAKWVEKAKLPISHKYPDHPDWGSEIDNSVVIDGNTIVLSGDGIVRIFERDPSTGVRFLQLLISVLAVILSVVITRLFSFGQLPSAVIL